MSHTCAVTPFVLPTGMRAEVSKRHRAGRHFVLVRHGGECHFGCVDIKAGVILTLCKHRGGRHFVRHRGGRHFVPVSRSRRAPLLSPSLSDTEPVIMSYCPSPCLTPPAGRHYCPCPYLTLSRSPLLPLSLSDTEPVANWPCPYPTPSRSPLLPLSLSDTESVANWPCPYPTPSRSPLLPHAPV